MNVTKSLLAAVIAGPLATATVAAQQTPTVGDILKASGLTVTGYVDVSYTNFDHDAPALHVFDTEADSFNLHVVDVAIGYQPADGVGGFVQLDFGPDANVFGAVGTGRTDEFDVQEAYVQYAGGGLTVIGGKFATLAGAEVIESPANLNFSRSFLFGFAIPFTHTGVRATFASGDSLKFIAGLNNGWDILKESAAANTFGTQQADGKTVELGVNAMLSKELSLAASLYSGEEVGAGGIDTRTLLDLVLTFNLSDALSFVFNYDQGEQDEALAGGGTAKWNGFAAYVNYKLSDTWRVAGRFEQFDDEDGFRTGAAQELNEVTVTLGYAPSANSEIRFEVRQDESDEDVFNGGSDDSQRLFGVQALYKF